MQRVRRLVVQAFLLAVLTTVAHAADPKLVFGRWIEKFPNGNGMVTEFTPTQMLSYTVDAYGQRTKSVGQLAVTYKDLDPTTIGVDFQGGGGIMLVVKDKDSILMDFPGMGAHTLTRMSGN
jgi:hypothetical protein